MTELPAMPEKDDLAKLAELYLAKKAFAEAAKDGADVSKQALVEAMQKANASFAFADDPDGNRVRVEYQHKETDAIKVKKA